MKLCKKDKKSKEEQYKVFVAKQNKAHQKKFSNTPFQDRIIFVPHCMRNTVECIAEEKDFYYVCKNCGKCSISEIKKISQELNYGGMYILKGGRAILKILKEKNPKAVIGIACYYEGDLGFKVLKDFDVAVQYAPLLKDGCTDTEADMEAVREIIIQREEEEGK